MGRRQRQRVREADGQCEKENEAPVPGQAVIVRAGLAAGQGGMGQVPSGENQREDKD